ncbi:TIGR02680 family protein [Promicromonospora sp. NPDC023987]|uniref:TIGR02680 family protein n=1 Tax=Promicromonospora sp. NPDC023987 TaxID=3155360 RepID=UPI0033C21127
MTTATDDTPAQHPGGPHPEWQRPGRTTPSDDLPRPTTPRWQPLRLGLVDLFYYDDEQFWFHDGRLLLRGNNGTGKSKVLALTLPFLLDGSILPRRVEPDADPKKRMEWNLLLGGAHPHHERTGYSWVEFGRLDADGTEHYCTLGIGLKAATGRAIAKSWYFVTEQRIGDLRLMDQSRTVLSQERLRDAIEPTGAGHVFSTQESYRRAVDEKLFRLGEERYAALVDLLIQLRQPQLSKRPDEKALSAALTEALAPLDQAVVSDVAESFRSLEEEREGIAAQNATLAAANRFLDHYRGYARVATRRATTSVRLTNSDYEHVGRDQREVEADLTAAVADVEHLAERQVLAEDQQGALAGEESALRESPEMRNAQRLDQASQAAADAEGRAGAAEAEATSARERADREAAAQERAADAHDAAAQEADRYATRAARLAAAAGLDFEAHASDETAARRAVDRRREQISHVRGLLKQADDVRRRADRASEAVDNAATAEAGRQESAGQAQLDVDTRVGQYRDYVRAYLGGLRAIELAGDLDEQAVRAEDWARTLEGEPPAKVAVDAAAGARLADLERSRAQAEHEASLLSEELAGVRNRIAELESGRDPLPPAAPGREAGVRVSASGAPLWRLTDFVPGVVDEGRAGIEAALQSAGLLDAWVFPDGTVQADGDVVLSGAAGRNRGSTAGGPTLAEVLVPAVGPDAEVPEAAVAAVLGGIGLGEASGAVLWVDPSGRWGAGPARGSWAKDTAAYIGAGAREANRRAVLARLAAEAADLTRGVEAARAEMREAERQADQVAAERDAYPTSAERALAALHARVTEAVRELEQAREILTRLRTDWEWADGDAREAEAELAETAGQLGVRATAEGLDQDLTAVGAYAEALVEVRTSARAVTGLAQAHVAAVERVAEARSVLEARDSALRDQRGEATRLRATANALQNTVGASVAELQGRLAAIGEAKTKLVRELKAVTKAQLEAAATHGRLEERKLDLAARRDEAGVARSAAIEALRVFAATGLLRVALRDVTAPSPEEPEAWTVTSTLTLARTVEQEFASVDESDEAWRRAQQHVSSASNELSAQMSRHGHNAYVEQHGDVLVARVRYVTDDLDVDQLAVRLEDDIVERERLLSAREREILENHLVNEVAGHLHELLLTAQGQIERMNRELADRKTSTGMQLRVVWRERADGPAGLAGARDLMTRADATWTKRDRAAIGEFLQARIAEVREADPTAGWQEHLERALDYRQWHTFGVERRQNGQWRSATGPASGGERVLAMSVPLFAAASSHYNSASPQAPRLILLDEAFAGVDDDSRAKSLGLLATFDLDVVMTSEREWGCYPQVPGLAIAQLSRVEGIDAVGITRWRWDGRRRNKQAEVGDDASAAAPATDGAGGADGGAETERSLFDA